MVFSLYDWIAGGFSDWTLRVRLYTAYTGSLPPPWNLLQLVEPTYLGYAPLVVRQPTGYTQNPDASRYVEITAGAFVVSLSNEIADSVAGAYLTATGGNPLQEFLLNVQPFTDVRRMQVAGDTMPVSLVLYSVRQTM